MKIPTISIVMAASILLTGCGKKSVSSGTSPSAVTITNPVISTNSIWAQQRRADELASASGDVKAAQRVCIGNLRQIDGAKNMWFLENHKQNGDVPTKEDLLPYVRSWPVCPSGGTYTINAIGTLPTCSIPGHAIPTTK